MSSVHLGQLIVAAMNEGLFPAFGPQAGLLLVAEGVVALDGQRQPVGEGPAAVVEEWDGNDAAGGGVGPGDDLELIGVGIAFAGGIDRHAVMVGEAADDPSLPGAP